MTVTAFIILSLFFPLCLGMIKEISSWIVTFSLTKNKYQLSGGWASQFDPAFPYILVMNTAFGLAPDSRRKSCLDDDPDKDETFGERMWGLTEMFPESVRRTTRYLLDRSSCCLRLAYSFSRTALFILFSSSALLVAPLMFEIERTQFEDERKCQQKELLLGPNMAVSGGSKGLPTYWFIPIKYSVFRYYLFFLTLQITYVLFAIFRTRISRRVVR